jgi:hypothetical protein
MGPLPYLSFAYIVFLLTAVASWVTHIVTCINQAAWLFLIAGAILPPIGIIHGYGVWFGFW